MMITLIQNSENLPQLKTLWTKYPIAETISKATLRNKAAFIHSIHLHFKALFSLQISY